MQSSCPILVLRIDLSPGFNQQSDCFHLPVGVERAAARASIRSIMQRSASTMILD